MVSVSSKGNMSFTCFSPMAKGYTAQNKAFTETCLGSVLNSILFRVFLRIIDQSGQKELSAVLSRMDLFICIIIVHLVYCCFELLFFLIENQILVLLHEMMHFDFIFFRVRFTRHFFVNNNRN